MNTLAQRFTGWLGGMTRPAGDALPVRLGGMRGGAGSAPVRMSGFDQALIWVTVALLVWGLVMVYSASIAMPDNPKFARYAHTHFLTRHVLSLMVAFVAALIAFQVPVETWEKLAPWLFVASLVLLIDPGGLVRWAISCAGWRFSHSAEQPASRSAASRAAPYKRPWR